MVGLVSSITVTVWVAIVIFPLPSVTVQVTVVTPIGNAIGALLVILAIEQLSVTVGVIKFTPVAKQVDADKFSAIGAVITGAVTSTTVIT